jgi:hypothetical protein
MYISYVPKFVKHAPINPDKRGSMTHPHIGKYSMSYAKTHVRHDEAEKPKVDGGESVILTVG